jgi:hypothetical protein
MATMTSAPSTRLSLTGVEIAVATWGVVGVLALVAQALVRLTPLALEPLATGMTSLQWALYLGWIAFNAYAEGYRGFQLSFSPRVVARAVHLARHPNAVHVLLAPVYCMALFQASRRRMIVAWVLLIAIVAIVVAVRMLPQPWRGIVDAGVVVGLGWGGMSIVMIFGRAILFGDVPPNDSLVEPA